MKNPIKLFYRLKYIERYEEYIKSKKVPLAILLLITNILGGLVFGYVLGTIGGGLLSATNAFFPSTDTNSSSPSSNFTTILRTNVNTHGLTSSLISTIKSSFVDRFVLDFPSVHHHVDDSSMMSATPSPYNPIEHGNNVDTLKSNEEMFALLFNVKTLLNMLSSSLMTHNISGEASSFNEGWTKFKIKPYYYQQHNTFSLLMNDEQNSTASVSSSSVDLNTTLLQGLFSGSIFIGGLVGCLFSMFTGPYFGKKANMLICCLVSMLGSIGATASYTYASLIVFRCILGVGAGISTTICSVYVSELMPFSKYQGVLGSMYNLGLAIGVVFGYVFGAAFVRFSDCWRAVHAFHNLWCILLFLVVFFVIPESPSFVKSPDEERTINNSTTTATNNIELEEKIQKTRTSENKGDIEKNETLQAKENPISIIGALKRLFCSKIVIQLILGCYGCFALQWTGIQSSLSFTPGLMASAGLTDPLDQQLVSLGIAIWQVLTILPTLFLIDRLGRKIIVLFGMSVCFLADIAEGFIFQFSENGTDYKIILAVIFICIFLLGFNVGIGSLCFILAHEVFNGENEKVIMIGTSLSTLTMWMTTIVLSLFFIPLVSVTSQAVPWFIFAGITLIGLLLYIFLLNETSPTILDKRAEKKRLKENEGKPEKTVPVSTNESNTENGESMPVPPPSDPISEKTTTTPQETTAQEPIEEETTAQTTTSDNIEITIPNETTAQITTSENIETTTPHETSAQAQETSDQAPNEDKEKETSSQVITSENIETTTSAQSPIEDKEKETTEETQSQV